jgi:hypothetical protein
MYRSIDEYIVRVDHHMELARTAPDPRRRILHLQLARGYLSLVALARKYEGTTLAHESPAAFRAR